MASQALQQAIGTGDDDAVDGAGGRDGSQCQGWGMDDPKAVRCRLDSLAATQPSPPATSRGRLGLRAAVGALLWKRQLEILETLDDNYATGVATDGDGNVYIAAITGSYGYAYDAQSDVPAASALGPGAYSPVGHPPRLAPAAATRSGNRRPGVRARAVRGPLVHHG